MSNDRNSETLRGISARPCHVRWVWGLPTFSKHRQPFYSLSFRLRYFLRELVVLAAQMRVGIWTAETSLPGEDTLQCNKDIQFTYTGEKYELSGAEDKPGGRKWIRCNNWECDGPEIPTLHPYYVILSAWQWLCLIFCWSCICDHEWNIVSKIGAGRCCWSFVSRYSDGKNRLCNLAFFITLLRRRIDGVWFFRIIKRRGFALVLFVCHGHHTPKLNFDKLFHVEKQHSYWIVIE